MKIFLLTIVLASCVSADCKDPKNASTAKCAIENAVVDCTTANAKEFVSQHLSGLSTYFTTDGIDWAAVADALKSFAVPEAMCVLETAWENHLNLALLSPLPASGTNPPMKLHSISTDQATKNKLEAKLWPGRSAKLH